MLENVGGIMSTRGKPYIKVLTDTLSAIGYKIQLKNLQHQIMESRKIEKE